MHNIKIYYSDHNLLIDRLGENASLRAIHEVVPSLCPQSFGWGRFTSSPMMSFLVTEFLDFSSRSASTSVKSDVPSLAAKLARLHTTAAPIPEGYSEKQFGFPATTCCGDTPQDNSYKSSWADFFANNRLRFILKRSELSNGKDAELHDLVEATIQVVVPRLISDDHLNNGHGVNPVVVHGDLWSGNVGKGRIEGQGTVQDVIYDPSACYAHSEYELGIMKMFGGFGNSFFEEYHSLCPKSEPVEEYGDRVALYELYHHLNHHVSITLSK
jgi:protein-ribulosamine 3-kinase